MSFFDRAFNAAEAADQFDNFEGDFVMVITKAELKATKSGGEMIATTAQVVDGPRKGRVVFDNFNVVNSNPTAQAIGRAQLGRLCAALGVQALRHESELCGKPFVGTVAIEEGKNGYQDRMKLTAYAPTSAAPVHAAPPQAAPAQTGTRKPWMKAPAVAPAAVPAEDPAGVPF